ncbi:MAG: YraN family protein [Actinomycetes bacterium]
MGPPRPQERSAAGPVDRSRPRSAVEVVVVDQSQTSAPRRRNQELGRYGEDVATRYLVAQGLAILERNWRCSLGELDIVAREGDALVVCEVKTRTSRAYGTPAEAVTVSKRSRLRRLAVRWVQEHDVHPAEIRIDVLAVLRPASGPAHVEHLRGVV